MLSHPLARLAATWVACLVLLLLALPLGLRVGAAHASLGFLREFLVSDTAPPARPAPASEVVALGPGLDARLWRPDRPAPYPGLVLVHGLTPDGKDDARLGWAAAALARAGYAVLVPDLPALRAQRLRPGDAAVIGAGIARLAGDPAAGHDSVAVVAISVGAGPALAAAADSKAGERVRLVVSLGGYAEARELVRYFTTGHYGFREVTGQIRLDPALAREFLVANLDLVRDPADRVAVEARLRGQPLPSSAGPEARAVLAVLENRDPARVDALLAALPAETRALLDALSPIRDVTRLAARLLLVHGRDDPAVPYTESLRLAAVAHPTRTRLILVDLVAHVEGRTPAWRQAWDFVKLWSAVYELFRS